MQDPCSDPFSPPDVPLAEYMGSINLGFSNGISWGDFDADGWPDLFNMQSGRLFRNCDGQSWEEVCDLVGNNNLLPPGKRYGSSFGDYNNDGLPDIGCEPRTAVPSDPNCFHLLRNLGGWTATCQAQTCNFDDAGDGIAISPPHCGDPDHPMTPTALNAETICWGDVDGDANLDLFVPAYIAPVGGATSLGNRFFYNQGPNLLGDYTFEDQTVQVGLVNTTADPPPEGAQFVDHDFDGDIDLYCYWKLFRNVSTESPQVVLFEDLTAASGLPAGTAKDEGTLFFDKDLDGDYDLFVLKQLDELLVFEAKGDGTYEFLDPATGASPVLCPELGSEIGISAADWDNDGDLDLTTQGYFRRNDLDFSSGTPVESFGLADHDLDPNEIAFAIPAWGDWDRDGDLDCAIANHLKKGHFYENTLYDSNTPDDQRRYVRVRIVRDDPSVPRGLETEYGATAEIHVNGEGTYIRRRQFVSSSGGYINQNEYSLHFGMPADPDPLDPNVDLAFDVSVDFTDTSDVYRRVDKYTNPALGSIPLAQLNDHEITVYRSGKVAIEGVMIPPTAPQAADLETTERLIEAQNSIADPLNPVPIPIPPIQSLGANSFVGLALQVHSNASPVRVAELIIDGPLAANFGCGSLSGNVYIWDTTVPGSPALVSNGLYAFQSRTTNDRAYYPTDCLLAPGREYRVVAGVTGSRPTPITLNTDFGPLTVLGGLFYTDANPCSGHGVEAAPILASTGMALRFGDV